MITLLRNCDKSTGVVCCVQNNQVPHAHNKQMLNSRNSTKESKNSVPQLPRIVFENSISLLCTILVKSCKIIGGSDWIIYWSEHLQGSEKSVGYETICLYRAKFWMWRFKRCRSNIFNNLQTYFCPQLLIICAANAKTRQNSGCKNTCVDCILHCILYL